jgi:hypothetical protein
MGCMVYSNTMTAIPMHTKIIPTRCSEACDRHQNFQQQYINRPETVKRLNKAHSSKEGCRGTCFSITTETVLCQIWGSPPLSSLRRSTCEKNTGTDRKHIDHDRITRPRLCHRNSEDTLLHTDEAPTCSGQCGDGYAVVAEAHRVFYRETKHTQTSLMSMAFKN